MERRLLLDVVVRERAAVLQLLARKDQALLVRGDALLVLDLGLDVVDRVRRLDLKGDGLARQGLHENLHGCCRTRRRNKQTGRAHRVRTKFSARCVHAWAGRSDGSPRKKSSAPDPQPKEHKELKGSSKCETR